MWAILKYEKKYLNILKIGFSKQLGNSCKFYQPKIKYSSYIKNRLIQKKFFLLDNYIFLHHEDLKNEKIINRLKYTKGLKYFLTGYSLYQKEIKFFVEKCNKSEDKNGFINNNFISLMLYGQYKLKTGPFVDKIFKLVSLNKNFLEIMFGNLKTKIKYNSHIVVPA